MGKPTIEEIEELLDGKNFDVVIMPNGEIKAACKNCLKLKKRIVELEKSPQSNVEADAKRCGSCGGLDIKDYVCSCDRNITEDRVDKGVGI